MAYILIGITVIISASIFGLRIYHNKLEARYRQAYRACARYDD